MHISFKIRHDLGDCVMRIYMGTMDGSADRTTYGVGHHSCKDCERVRTDKGIERCGSGHTRFLGISAVKFLGKKGYCGHLE